MSYITLEQKKCKVSVLVSNFNKVKVKVKFILEQATKAQRRNRSIALLFL